MLKTLVKASSYILYLSNGHNSWPQFVMSEKYQLILQFCENKHGVNISSATEASEMNRFNSSLTVIFVIFCCPFYREFMQLKSLPKIIGSIFASFQLLETQDFQHPGFHSRLQEGNSHSISVLITPLSNVFASIFVYAYLQS